MCSITGQGALAKIVGDSMVIPCAGLALYAAVFSSLDASKLPKDFLQPMKEFDDESSDSSD